MSAPRTKRQFAGAASDPAQRQITSFFRSSANTAISPSAGNTSGINQASSQTSPGLPSSVQANLLSVGMRVRKSVPEGYKTGSYSAFSLWDETNTDAITATMGEGQRSRANAFSAPRELLPFCGINKVGGLGTQPEDRRPTATSAYPNLGFALDGTIADDDDIMPGLTSSQETVDSDASGMATPGARTRKRFFVEDADDMEGAAGQFNPWRYTHHHHHPNESMNNNTSLSPRGLAQTNGRAMAVPRKGGLRAKFSGMAAAIPGAGQENLMVVNDDFDEAEFLDRGTWEVDMDDA